MQWFERVGLTREWEWCKQIFERICGGGNPFMDLPPVEHETASGHDHVGAIEFQLRLPRLGGGVLKLDL
jgi:hypothetical protein